MNKMRIALSIAGVFATAAFAPEASALPAFARQTGMACTACHFQHFPVLNKFGQAFKAAGYTMMGAQTKIEGENLSIPDTANASMLIKAIYLKNNSTVTAGAAGDPSHTQKGQGIWGVPDEMILFLGGRVNDHVGFLFEGNTISSGIGGNLLDGFVMPFDYEVGGGVNVGVIPFFTTAMGPGHGFELGSGGATRGVRFAQQRTSIMAQQYVGLGVGEATGLALVARNDLGYVNFSKWSPNAYAFNGLGATQFTSNYLRIAATPSVQDWNLHFGVQLVTGENYAGGSGTATSDIAAVGGLNATAPTAADLVTTKASAVDFQAQGQVGGKDLSIYAAYATAPSVAAVAGGGTNGNFYNGGAKAKTATSIAADYSLIQNTWSVGAAYRAGKTGAATDDVNNALSLMTVYNLYQNVSFHINYTKFSGSSVTPGKASNEWIAMMMAGF